MNGADFDAIRTTAALALATVALLLPLATPLAWWLARRRHGVARLVEATVALPLVLPPTVLGFYLLLLLSPGGVLGRFWVELTGEALAFSFAGLVIASCVYSLPFAVQPLQGAFEAIGRKPIEAAHSLGATPSDTFRHVVLPLARRGYVTAAALTFAHTLGEFGVVLIVGGNIAGETRVLSIRIFEHVETLNYAAAHRLAAGLLLIAFAILLLVYLINDRHRLKLAGAGG